jgi:hypothetical protein
MDDKTLDALVEQRKKEAADKNLFFKAKVIALNLGHGQESRDDTEKGYNDGEFTIGYKDGIDWGSDGGMPYSSLTVIYKGREVFKEGLWSLECYIPGPETWEPRFEELYAKAEQAGERKKNDATALQAQQEENARAEKARRFGL